jgi:hypothetical protein
MVALPQAEQVIDFDEVLECPWPGSNQHDLAAT